MDTPDYILDLSSNPAAADGSAPLDTQQSKTENKVASLSIYFKCCQVYAPIYRNAAGNAYAGHCPRCHRRAVIPIGPGGSTARIFQAE